jgi:hypothetical protein
LGFEEVLLFTSPNVKTLFYLFIDSILFALFCDNQSENICIDHRILCTPCEKIEEIYTKYHIKLELKSQEVSMALRLDFLLSISFRKNCIWIFWFLQKLFK